MPLSLSVIRRSWQSGAIVLTALTMAFASAVLAEASPHTAAVEMVRQLRLGSNFETMAGGVATATQTYRTIVAKVGATKAKDLVSRSLQHVIPRYQSQWDESLAASYAEVLSTLEMGSLTKDRQKSPFYEKFVASSGAVGAKMQARSATLLQEATTEALSSALAATASK